MRDKGTLLIKMVAERGWNLYDSTEATADAAMSPDFLRRGPVKGLEVARKYALMPVCENTSDPKNVMAALERVALSLDRQMPTISIWPHRWPLTGFKVVDENIIKIITTAGHNVTYERAVEAARTLYNTISLRYD